MLVTPFGYGLAPPEAQRMGKHLLNGPRTRVPSNSAHAHRLLPYSWNVLRPQCCLLLFRAEEYRVWGRTTRLSRITTPIVQISRSGSLLVDMSPASVVSSRRARSADVTQSLEQRQQLVEILQARDVFLADFFSLFAGHDRQYARWNRISRPHVSCVAYAVVQISCRTGLGGSPLLRWHVRLPKDSVMKQST